MQVPVNQITPKSIFTNAILIQPTPFCALNCKGCYTKSFKGQVQEQLIVDLIASISSGGLIQCNQVTLAVDNLSDLKSEVASQKAILLAFLLHAKQRKTSTNFNITVNSSHALREYGDLDLSGVHMISISNPKSGDSALHKNVSQNLVGIGAVRQVLDSVYYVLHKPDLGFPVDVIGYFDKMPRGPGVVIDTCVADSLKFLKTGASCSAGISKFHIWPDGSVTGCPYNQGRETPGSQGLEGLCENINKVYTASNEFSRCKIPQAIDSKSKPRLLNIIN